MLTHKGTMELYTERLKLRKFVLSDATYMYKNYATDARVTRFLNWEPYKCVEDVEAFLKSVIGEYELKNTYHWAMEFKGEVIGSISIIHLNERDSNCEIGYCIGYDYWNKGITSEALTAVNSFLFNEVGMHRITAKHDVDNPASGKVMQKCNMIFEGRMRGYYLHSDGTYSDALFYSILKDEFKVN